MSRRDSDVATLTCAVNVREHLAIQEMKRMTGIYSDANLVRVALYRYAAFLESETDAALFAIRAHEAEQRQLGKRARIERTHNGRTP